MIPILYASAEKLFTTNGIGRLADAISCKVVEERNGTYELEMTYPIDGVHYSDLAEDRIIFAKPYDGAVVNQAFRIYKISRPINGIVTVSAEHISYILNKMVVMPFTATSCAGAIASIVPNAADPCPFTFSTDKSVNGKFTLKEPKAIRAVLGGEQGSLLDVYGTGEYEFNNFDVILRVNRGSNNGVTLRYAKNITDLNRETDATDVYTGIVPFWKNDEVTITLPEKVIFSSYANTFAYKIIKPVDFSSSFDNPPTVDQLRTRANKYLTDNEGWKIKDNITVSFVNLADTFEYADVSNLQRVGLCDTVKIIYTKLGVNVEAKVVKTDYDVLRERYNSIEIGSPKTNLYKTITEETYDAIVPQVTSYMDSALNYAQKMMQGGLGGYVVTTKNADGQPQEILILNTPDINTATKVMRLNLGGIAFSDGYNARPRTAWTIDGHFVADFIDTGTLNANIIKTGIIMDRANRNMWNMDTGEFRLSASSAIDNGTSLAQIKANSEGITLEAEERINAINGEKARAEGAEDGLSSRISVLPGTITFGVTSTKVGKSTGPTITMTVKRENGTQIINTNQQILLDGDVVFTSNLTDGATVISGDNIRTGNISFSNTKIGGWSLNGNRIFCQSPYKSGSSATVYQAFLQSVDWSSETGASDTESNSYAYYIGNRKYNGSAWVGSWKPNFYVRYNGEMFANKGTIAGWIIDSDSIYYGTKETGTADNDVTLKSNGVFTRRINGTNRSNLKFAIGANFGVNQAGGLFSSSGEIGGFVITEDSLYYKRNAKHCKIPGVYIGNTGIAVGGTSKYDFPFFEVNYNDSITYANQIILRNDDGSKSHWGINVSSDDDGTGSGGNKLIDRIRIGCAIKTNYNGGKEVNSLGGITHADIPAYNGDSDIRIKKNITDLPIKSAIQSIKSLSPVIFEYKQREDYGDTLPPNKDLWAPEGIHHGFIAQESVQNNWDLVYKTSESHGDLTDILAIRYTEIIADLVAVNQNLLERVEKLEEALHG